jgi:hypothetical protein
MADPDEQAPTRPYYDGPPSTRPRMYAAPFGALPGMTPPTSPPPPPGFNVQPDTPSQTNPMSSLLASFMPSGQDLKRGVADTLGAPVDMAGWALRMMGVPISGDQYYGGGGFNRSGLVAGEPTWTPGPSVPLSSANIRGMLDNPPPLDAFLQAMRRYGHF